MHWRTSVHLARIAYCSPIECQLMTPLTLETLGLPFMTGSREKLFKSIIVIASLTLVVGETQVGAFLAESKSRMRIVGSTARGRIPGVEKVSRPGKGIISALS